MKEDIKSLLPQKDPFRFIDCIESYDSINEIIICSFTFRHKMVFFKGHFPSNPIVPGVLLIEVMAQSAVLLNQKINTENDTRLPYLTKISDAVFKNPLYPETKIFIQTKLIRKINRFQIIESNIKSENGEKIAQCSLVVNQ